MRPHQGGGALRRLLLLAHISLLHGWVSPPGPTSAPWLRWCSQGCPLLGAGRGPVTGTGRNAACTMRGARGRAAPLRLAAMSGVPGRPGKPPPPPQKRHIDLLRADDLQSEEEREKEDWEVKKGRAKANTAFHADNYDDENDLVPRDGLYYHDNKGNLRKMKFAFDLERGDGELEADEIYYDFMEQDADSMKAWKGNEVWDEWRKRASDWMFFDQARVYVKGGDGGDGEVAYRREAHVPLGGPFGGSGGSGGDVVFVADGGDNTLASVRANLHMIADSGRCVFLCWRVRTSLENTAQGPAASLLARLS